MEALKPRPKTFSKQFYKRIRFCDLGQKSVKPEKSLMSEPLIFQQLIRAEAIANLENMTPKIIYRESII